MRFRKIEDLSDEEFIDREDKLTFLEYLKDPGWVLMEMANVVGNYVKIEPSRLPFSFHFCGKNAVHQQHGIRVKVLWNPSKAPSNADGYFELHGDYEYKSGSHKYFPNTDERKIARKFFKKYKVLFAAVWEEVLDAKPVQDYFEGRIKFNELLSKFDIEDEINYYNLNHCKSLTELEDCVRKYNIFNMND